jgi:hypothetical protein
MKEIILLTILCLTGIVTKAQNSIERIKERREFVLKSGIASLKSNMEKQEYYLNLVALDVAYYKIVPDSALRKQMGNHYNSLAWYSILTQDLNDAAYAVKQSIKYNPSSNYPYSNRPLVFLLKGRFHKAKRLYLKLKDQQFNSNGTTFKDEFLEDFRELAAEGITSEDIKKITKLLET